MDLETIKKYAVIDYDDDDDLLNLFIEIVKEYISGGFSEYDENNSRHKLILLKGVKYLYDNRDLVNEDRITASIRLQEHFKDEGE